MSTPDITPARLCELEARVCACGSGANIDIIHFEALMGCKWCEETKTAEDGDPLKQE